MYYWFFKLQKNSKLFLICQTRNFLNLLLFYFINMISGGYFLTGSKYSGNFDHDTGIIDGVGTYIYPDGSEYRGFFKQGKFHGYGTISIKNPHKMLYVGKFNNCSLEKIEEIVFSDGIRVQADQFGENFTFENWDYLYKNDRRFATELISGLNPVGPDSLLTNSQPTRVVPNNTYDTGDGFFHPASGFTGFVFTGNAFDTRPIYFVSCKKEFNWICRNCRSSQSLQLPEPIQKQVEQLVLQNNLKCENIKCDCGKSRKEENTEQEVIGKMEKDEVEVEVEEEDENSVTDSVPSSFWLSDESSSSADSLLEVPLKLDMKCVNKTTEALFNPTAHKPSIHVYSTNVKNLIKHMHDDSSSDD